MQLLTYNAGIKMLDETIPGHFAQQGLPKSIPSVSYKIPTDSGKKTVLAHNIICELFTEDRIILITDEIDIFPSCQNEFLLSTTGRASLKIWIFANIVCISQSQKMLQQLRAFWHWFCTSFGDASSQMIEVTYMFASRTMSILR